VARWAVESLCSEAVAKKGDADIEEIFRWIKNFRNYSESGRINAISEIYEKSFDTRWMKWASRILKGIDHDRRVKMLTRIAYNIVLNGVNRRISEIRNADCEGSVPNLSTILLATSSKCNLECSGCESASERGDGAATFEEMDYIVGQARKLNIFHVVIIGKGEPLYDSSHKKALFRLIEKHWDLNFILITNGTRLFEADIARMRRADNTFVLVSIDGLRQTNDARRGEGVYDEVSAAMRLMKEHGLYFGFSSTVYRSNYRELLSEAFLSAMRDLGCVAGLYLRYIPLGVPGEGSMLMNDSESRQYECLFRNAMELTPIPILDPDIFERASGCRARRGSLVYIDATTGQVMPCAKTPFAPSECNILSNPHDNRLKEILETNFYVNFRNGYDRCRQCSSNLTEELNCYLSEPGLALRDRTKAENYLERLARE
jgi:MoaA/NifB/PqqE/SkfB family radical SAM enzyme